jgi:hypothetical protein
VPINTGILEKMNKNICFVATAQWNVGKKNLSTIEPSTHCTSINTTYCKEV